ncbi:hypothetical protein DPMN_169391 [Dreissena polymorpha]|uniref:Uncharacterized protein n=1 Tax=Dreissena polymorpha TaxID=45954 RepID=A0A9D4DXP0_DREPO|nr:hypothetical protein DPMN_169391 [Dreissena polymorpha]
MAYLWRLHYHEYYRLSIAYLLMCAVHAVLAWLGFKYTAGTGQGTTNTPYHVMNIPTASVYFIETVVSLIIFVNGRMAYSKDNQKSSTAKTLDTFNTFVSCFVCVWGVVGCVLIANSGLCIQTDKCYYTINMGQNLAVAITSLFLHVVLIFVHFFSLVCSSKGHYSNEITPLPPNLQSTSSNITPQSQAGSNNTRPSILTNPSEILRLMKDPRIKQNIESPTENDTGNNRKLRRQTSEFLLNAVNDVSKRPEPYVVNGNFSDESLDHRMDKTLEKPKSSKSMLDSQSTPLAPPPTYAEAIYMPSGEVIIANPYYLPPLISRPSRLRVPEHIYSGTNYPDEELEIAHAQSTNGYM